MATKVLLINSRPKTKKVRKFPSYSLALLSAVLKKKKFETGYCDLTFAKNMRCALEELKNLIPKYRFFALSTHSETLVNDKKVIDLIKKENPASIVIIGGYGVVQPMEALLHTQADFIVVGPGEVMLPKIIKIIEKHDGLTEGAVEKLRKYEGLLIRYDVNGEENFLATGGVAKSKSFHELPQPDYDLIEGIQTFHHGPLTFSGMWYFTSRGCPYKCGFCAIPDIKGRVWEPKPWKQVVEELKCMVDKYHPEYIEFGDDAWTINKKRVINICKGIIEEGLHKEVKFACASRCDNIDPEIIKHLLAANFKIISLGMESYSENTLKELSKDVTKKQIDDALNWVTEIKVDGKGFDWVFTFFIYFTPDTCIEDFLETIGFAIRCIKKGVWIVPNLILIPYPETSIYKKLEKENRLLLKNTIFKDHRLFNIEKDERVPAPFPTINSDFPLFKFKDPRMEALFELGKATLMVFTRYPNKVRSAIKFNRMLEEGAKILKNCPPDTPKEKIERAFLMWLLHRIHEDYPRIMEILKARPPIDRETFWLDEEFAELEKAST